MSTDENLSEYTNPEEYDAENTWAADDDFYLELVQQIGGPILDAGCGTGRLTRAFAADGLDVTGLDLSPQMLGHAQHLSDGLNVEWLLGDVRTMQLGRRFRLITMTSHGFQHMMTDGDIGDFFDRTREHLLDDGYLAFETRNFAAKTFGGSEEPTLWHSFQDQQGHLVDVLIGSHYDPDSGIERLTEERVVQETGEHERSTFALRYVSVENLNSMLREHGFSIVQQYGDWHKGPLGDDQPEVISICQPSLH
ncbi:MAG: class I SAM-dependent methyltransferase [Chloroflexia bacterium]|nr:class I SAM-dependent methyltransferase [Chloroflexia bacterium]